MNFACATEKEFSTTKNVITKKKLSELMKKKNAYMDNHNFSVTVTPSGKCKLTATKR